MSLWTDIEITRLRGDLMAYVIIQNDWTGQTRGRIATIVSQNGRKHIVADGRKHDVTELCERYIRQEEKIKTALEWFNKTKF